MVVCCCSDASCPWATVRYERKGLGSTQDHHAAGLRTFHRGYGLQPPLPFQSHLPHSPAHTLCSNPWNLHLLECSLSSRTSGPLPGASLLPDSLCPQVFFWRTQTFVKSLKCHKLQKCLQTPQGKLSTSLHSHSALLITLSQHLPYHTPVIGSHACCLQ